MKIEDPDGELVRAVASRDEAAVYTFIRRYDGLIRASVSQGGYFIKDERDELELQNDIRRAVIESIGRWNRNESRFSTWVYGIARNILNGYLRERARGLETGRYGEEVSSEEPIPPLDNVEPEGIENPTLLDGVPWAIDDPDLPVSPLLKAFLAVSDELTEGDRATLDHMLSGDPHRIFAERRNVSEVSVKVRVSRFKKKLKNAIEMKMKTALT